jgi:hypothetical protein
MLTTALRYEELAHRLGIKPETARRMANKRRWRKTKDNHGRALVHVPEEYFASRAEAPTSAPGHGHGPGHGPTPGPGPMPSPGPTPGPAPGPNRTTEREAELLTKLETLQAEMLDMAQRLGAAEAVAAELRTDRDQWHAMAEALQRQLAERRPGWLSRLFRKAG